MDVRFPFRRAELKDDTHTDPIFWGRNYKAYCVAFSEQNQEKKKKEQLSPPRNPNSVHGLQRSRFSDYSENMFYRK